MSEDAWASYHEDHRRLKQVNADLLAALNSIVELDDLHNNEAPHCACATHMLMADVAVGAIAKAAATI